MLSTEARTLAGVIRTLISAVRKTGVPQRTLATRIGRQHSALSQWASGVRVPSTEDLGALIDVADVDDGTRHDIFLLHYNACGNPDPDYASIARYLIDRTTLAARDVADVLDALRACVSVTDDMCATTIDTRDLRSIAVECAGLDQTD